MPAIHNHPFFATATLIASFLAATLAFFSLYTAASASFVDLAPPSFMAGAE